MLLRALAASLHLDEAACRPKRAMQFRTRVVRAEEDHAKGGDICQKLMDGSVDHREEIKKILRCEDRCHTHLDVQLEDI
ncbi:hypothetical protein MRX96_044093 [Rhipicephalus microplus]